MLEQKSTTLKVPPLSPNKHTEARIHTQVRVLHTSRATGLKLSLIFYTHVNRGPGRLDQAVHEHHRYKHRCSICSYRHYQVSLGAPQV